MYESFQSRVMEDLQINFFHAKRPLDAWEGGGGGGGGGAGGRFKNQ